MSRKYLSKKKLKTACSCVCEMNAENFHNLNTDGVVLSDELLRRVDALLEEGKRKKTERRLRPKSVLVAAAIVLLTAVITCMSITAVREKIIQAFVTTYERYFSHEYDTAESEPEEFEVKLPTYLPEGYELATDYSHWGFVRIVYQNPNNSAIIRYEQALLGSTQYSINNENKEIHEVNIGSHIGTAVVSTSMENPSCFLLWNDGIYEYYLSSNLSLEETLRIAESIN